MEIVEKDWQPETPRQTFLVEELYPDAVGAEPPVLPVLPILELTQDRDGHLMRKCSFYIGT